MKKYKMIFCSYVFIEIRGKMPERFLSICKRRNIPLYEVYPCVTGKGTVYTAVMRLRDFWKLRPIARKADCVLLVKKRMGLPFFLHKYRSRLVFFAGGLYCFWLITLLSTFLWSITITGGFVHTQEELTAYLKEKNIVCGMRCSKIDCDRLEKQMRIDYPDIGWVSAELKGAKLIVQISETNQPGREDVPQEKSSLCASVDGIVRTILCTKGTPLVKEGDVVKKGDVLISGIVPVVGDNETLVSTNYVAAEGKIVLQSVKQYEYRFPAVKISKVFTGREKKGISFFWKKEKIFSLIPSHKYEKYDIIQRDVLLFWNEYFHFPVLLKKTSIQEYEQETSEYTKEEIEQLAGAALDRYVQYLTENGTKLLQAELATELEDGYILSRGKLVILSEAWERVPITEE